MWFQLRLLVNDPARSSLLLQQQQLQQNSKKSKKKGGASQRADGTGNTGDHVRSGASRQAKTVGPRHTYSSYDGLTAEEREDERRAREAERDRRRKERRLDELEVRRVSGHLPGMKSCRMDSDGTHCAASK